MHHFSSNFSALLFLAPPSMGDWTLVAELTFSFPGKAKNLVFI